MKELKRYACAVFVLLLLFTSSECFAHEGEHHDCDVVKEESTLTLSKDCYNYTYNRSQHYPEPHVTGSEAEICYSFYKDAACTQKLSGAPVNAGTYYMVAKLPEDECHKSACISGVKIVIKKSSVSLWLSSKTKAYTGKEIINSLNCNHPSVPRTWRYYKDPECKDRLACVPINIGIYYVQVTSSATENYKSCKSNVAKLTIKPRTQVTKSLTSPSSGKLKVTYNKDTKVSGYQIQASTSKTFSDTCTKSYRITKNATYSKCMSSLKHKKTYYVRVRAYKNLSSGKLYGSWSEVKSCVVK